MQDNISVTNQRVQFLWRKWLCGINLGTLEEAFDLDDLQVCVLSRCDCLHVTHTHCGGTTLLSPPSKYPSTRHVRDLPNLRLTLLVFACLPACSSLPPSLPALQFVTLNYACGCCCCCCSGMTLALNFSRANANIQGWTASAKVSGCRRTIKLPRSQAQDAYNNLQNLLQQRSQNKARK